MLRRKNDHIDICLNRNVDSNMSTGFDQFRLAYNALPEIDYDSVDIRTRFLDRQLAAPLMISAITGGTAIGNKINTALAKSAQKLNIPMCVGSQRAMLKGHTNGFQVREVAPDAMIFANLGAVQLNYGMNHTHCQNAVDMIRADALVLHLNPLQEAVQPEGNTDFRGLEDKIADVVSAVNVPVIVKEVGLGISAGVAKRLEKAGINHIDIGGAGGTSFAVVESYRRSGRDHVEYGIPTAQALVDIRRSTRQSIIASGGIRSASDIVKALCMGASLAGIAKPFLSASMDNTVNQLITTMFVQIKLAMFSVGAQKISNLNPEMLQNV